jgi:hypothetical protein
MSPTTREASLERAYGLLLMAYPRAYRRARGPEMLGVLVDGARPGQRYPRPGEAADLIGGGLRHRLGVHGSPGFADGLRIVLPVALVLAAGLSAGVRIGGLDTVPKIQPYAYVWAAALVAWVVSPLAGRVAATVAALVTIRMAAAWSYGFAEVFAVCLVGAVAAVAAIMAPRLASTVDGYDYGSALWRLPGRVTALLAGAALGGLSLVGLDRWSERTLTAAQLAVVVLAVAGVALAARRRGTSLLWAAGVLAPAAVALPLQSWPYDFNESIGRPGREYPWLLLRGSLSDVSDIVVPMAAAAAVVAALVVAVTGRAAAQRAATTFTRSTLAGLAAVTGAMEVAGGVPSIAVLAGCAGLVVLSVASPLLPRTVVAVASIAAALAVLSDITAPTRYARPWPLYVLALLVVLTRVQTLLENGRPATSADVRRPSLWSTVAGALAMFVVAAAVIYKAGHQMGFVDSYRVNYSNIEHRPLFLALPAFAVAVVIAGSLADRMPVRAGVAVAGAVGGLLWLAAPIRNLTVVAGIAVGAAIVAGLVGYLTARLRRAAPAREQWETTSPAT